MRRSAGILLHRGRGENLEVLLVHPGGPLFASRDLGAWSVPKGEHGPDEDPLAAARREFAEELGSPPPAGPFIDIGEVRLKSGKLVRAFAAAGDLDVSTVVSNTCELQWPPRSGATIVIPEIDRAQWFPLAQARRRINAGQVALLDRLAAAVEIPDGTADPREGLVGPRDGTADPREGLVGPRDGTGDPREGSGYH